jgi:alpha-ketoglutarate-dependent taurine dioxygenase
VPNLAPLKVDLQDAIGRAPSGAGALALLLGRQDELYASLRKRGALLFPNVKVESPEDLASLAEAIVGRRPMAYLGGDSPRDKKGVHVYTATELPPDVTIPLHSELSFRAKYPRYVLFYCRSPAEAGGDTLLGDARTVYEEMDGSVRREFESRGLRYVHTYLPSGAVSRLLNRRDRVQRDWSEVFESDDRSVVEQRCRDLGMEPSWKGDVLVATCHRPASAAHWATGERVWFNQAHFMAPSARFLSWTRYLEARAVYLHPALRMRAVTYGDGAPIEQSALDRIHDVLDAQAVRLRLEAGDLLVLDNMLCMHGRMPFRGRRDVLVAMTP